MKASIATEVMVLSHDSALRKQAIELSKEETVAVKMDEPIQMIELQTGKLPEPKESQDEIS